MVKIVSLGVSANWPKNAAFTQPSGITSGLSPALLGIKKAVIYGIIVGVQFAWFAARSSISSAGMPR